MLLVLIMGSILFVKCTTPLNIRVPKCVIVEKQHNFFVGRRFIAEPIDSCEFELFEIQVNYNDWMKYNEGDTIGN